MVVGFSKIIVFCLGRKLQVVYFLTTIALTYANHEAAQRNQVYSTLQQDDGGGYTRTQQDNDGGGYANLEQGGDYANLEQDYANLEQDYANLEQDYANLQQGDYANLEQGDYADTEQGDYADMEQGDYANLEQGDYADTEQGDYADTEQGDYADTEQNDYANLEQGDYADIEQGDYADAEQGDYADTEQGDYADTEQGDYADTEQQDGDSYAKLEDEFAGLEDDEDFPAVLQNDMEKVAKLQFLSRGKRQLEDGAETEQQDGGGPVSVSQISVLPSAQQGADDSKAMVQWNNGWRRNFRVICRAGYGIFGMQSVQNHHIGDRLFRFYCKRVRNTLL